MHQALFLGTEDKAVYTSTGIPAFMPKGVRQVKCSLDGDECYGQKQVRGGCW